MQNELESIMKQKANTLLDVLGTGGKVLDLWVLYARFSDLINGTYSGIRKDQLPSPSVTTLTSRFARAAERGAMPVGYLASIKSEVGGHQFQSGYIEGKYPLSPILEQKLTELFVGLHTSYGRGRLT